MGLISDNAAAFTELQQSIQTEYTASLTLEDVTIQVKQLQTDY